MTVLRSISILSTFSFAIAIAVGSANAQDNGGQNGGGQNGGQPTGGGDTGGGDTGVQGNDTFDTGDLVGDTTELQEIPDFDLQSITPEIENERLQPFVGPTGETIQHPLSQTEGGAGTGGNQFNFGNIGRGGTAGGGVGGSGPGFTVPRRSMRARLRNQISVPNVQFRDQNTSSRFQQRLVRIPALQNVNVTGVNISVEDRKATLTGTVSTPQQKQLVERMARLEPGIYSIDNQIRVTSVSSR